MSTEAKLMPPILPDQIPATWDDEVGGSHIYIPFQHSRAVSIPASPKVLWAQLKIRTIPNNINPLEGCSSHDNDIGEINSQIYQETIDRGFITFQLVHAPDPEVEEPKFSDYLNIGQYYKVQLKQFYAIQNEEEYKWELDTDGYFSNVGIMKFTTEGFVDVTSEDGLTYVGFYSQKYNSEEEPMEGDYSEKINKYKFEVMNRWTSEILYSTGWKVHNCLNDENEYEAHDICVLSKIYQSAYTQQITYSFITSGGAPYWAAAYPPTFSASQEALFSDVAEIESNFDNGYVHIKRLQSAPLNFQNRAIITRRNITTSSSLNDYYDIVYVLEDQNDNEFYDFTVEQGMEYESRLWAYDSDNSRYIKTSASDAINVDYEDMFLTDGSGRQLKVRYNPTVSAIHETILESKTDTIGGKYPFFSRNQNVRYRDFQICGLISLQMDEQHLFSELQSLPDQPSRERTQTTAAQDNQYLEDIKTYGYSSSLTDYSAPNYFRERMFRDEVLAWLNNGEYKLFRSPSEGILIVRLLSVNMTPYNGTGRMVYSFTAQAYEAMGHDIPDLAEFGLLRIEPINIEGGE